MDCFARHTVFLESRCDFGPLLHANCLIGGHVELRGSVFSHVLKTHCRLLMHRCSVTLTNATKVHLPLSLLPAFCIRDCLSRRQTCWHALALQLNNYTWKQKFTKAHFSAFLWQTITWWASRGWYVPGSLKIKSLPPVGMAKSTSLH